MLSSAGAAQHPRQETQGPKTHIKWQDWSGGKGTSAEGNIYFKSFNGGF